MTRTTPHLVVDSVTTRPGATATPVQRGLAQTVDAHRRAGAVA